MHKIFFIYIISIHQQHIPSFFYTQFGSERNPSKCISRREIRTQGKQYGKRFVYRSVAVSALLNILSEIGWKLLLVHNIHNKPNEDRNGSMVRNRHSEDRKCIYAARFITNPVRAGKAPRFKTNPAKTRYTPQFVTNQ